MLRLPTSLLQGAPPCLQVRTGVLSRLCWALSHHRSWVPTTTHEHIYIDFSFMYRPAQDTPSPEMADAPITLENLGWIRRNYYSNRSNLHLMDLNTMIKEVTMYREVGGGAIVDATTTAIGRNPDALARISRETGVHIIMGAGFYVDAVHPEDMNERTVEDLAREISDDITQGVDDSGIQAGIIGEVGCTWPLTPNERKSLVGSSSRAAGDGRGDTDSSRTVSGRASGNTGTLGEQRRGHIARHNGASGPYCVRVRCTSENCRVRLLSGVGPVWQ